jgi:hypothetical protein
MAGAAVPTTFCWTKMGAEAGEPLERILLRKEFERQANGGWFAWGVGNSVMTALAHLFAHGGPAHVVFSRMRAKPKACDSDPDSIRLWLAAQSACGKSYQIPPFSIVTSRGGTSSGVAKRTHYALICYSSSPIRLGSAGLGSVDATELVNFVSGRPLGASQVTAVVQWSGGASDSDARSGYPVDILATLDHPGQVKLTAAVPLSARDLRSIDLALDREDFSDWRDSVSELRQAAIQSARATYSGGQLEVALAL